MSKPHEAPIIDREMALLATLRAIAMGMRLVGGGVRSGGRPRRLTRRWMRRFAREAINRHNRMVLEDFRQ